MLEFYKKNYSIALDIDEVCADFLKGYSELLTKDHTRVQNFNFSYAIYENLAKVSAEWWLDLEPKFNPSELNFIPTCYISSRPITQDVTERWLEKNGFPCRPVYHVFKNSFRFKTKLQACKELGIQVFVDDYMLNFQELNAGGVRTLLFDSTHNRQFDVGQYRVKNVSDIPGKVMSLGW